MKRYFLFFCLMVSTLFAVSQTKVTFTGVSLDGSYCPFERVNVTNITRGWNETLVYPDTVLILSGIGVEEFSSSQEGITRVYPNPFEGFTNVEFGIPESGPVDIRVVGVDGVLKTSWEGYMQSGVHQVRIILEKPQMALVIITTEKERYVGKLLHIGEDGVNEIDMCPSSPVISDRSKGSSRSGESGDFRPGDMMSYEGVLLNCVGEIYSDKVIQEQFGDEIISLAFPVNEFGGEVQYLPYFQSFDYEFGTYLPFDVMGPQSWVIDYNTAKMTGYSGGSYYVNDDWLISSPVSLIGVSDAKMTIKYIGRYFHDLNEELTICASMDYAFCSDPLTANWTRLPASLTGSANWSDFETTEVALTEFVGRIVTFAVRYTSTDSNAGTIEIQSILIEEGTAGGGPTPPGPGGELQTLPYYQLFATEFGTYTTFDVLGPQSWMIDYQTAKMTGYSGGSHANEDWLISSPVALTGVENAKVSVAYCAQYQNADDMDVTLQISTDYVYGSNPTTANWTQMSAQYPNTSSFSNFQTVETSLNDFIGQNVYVAIKYTSTDDQSRTIEIQSITIEEGTVGGGPTPPGPGMGSGTADDPYNVAAGIGLQSEEPVAWVQGYIVGAVKSGLTSVNSNDDINWNPPFDLATNVLIADDVACHEISQCIIVNLPAGKPLRAQVNLVDHPENLGKQLSVLGKLRRYFGQAGLRDSNGSEADFVLEGGVTPPNPGTEIFSETFANGQGDFTIQDVVIPQELTYVWAHSPNYHCMKASAYVSQAYAAESWLVSPSIDLSDISAATLSFEQAVNYASPQGALKVMISTNYNGDVTTAVWNELNVDQWPAGNNWTFISSTADLTDYVGHVVTIAFKYTSTTSASATWEVKSFVVK